MSRATYVLLKIYSIVTDRAIESVLTDAFDEQQTERYEAYRRVKLKKETVRKVSYPLSLSSVISRPAHIGPDRQSDSIPIRPTCRHNNHQRLFQTLHGYFDRACP